MGTGPIRASNHSFKRWSSSPAYMGSWGV